MNKVTSFDTINCGNESGPKSIELASALLGENESGLKSIELASALLGGPYDDEMMSEIMSKLSLPNTTLFIPALPSKLGTGDVASNFRYKHDKDKNNLVIWRWIKIFEEYKKNESKNPVVITAVDRSDRYLTFKLQENGNIEVINNIDKKNINKTHNIYTGIINEFVKSFDITEEHMKKIRLSSEGARFNTYMADMIGYMNMMNWRYHPEIYGKVVIEPYIVYSESKFYRAEVEGQRMLQPVVTNGKTWTPKEGFNYMYFKNPSYKNKKVSQEFYLLNGDCMPKVYNQIFEALHLQENETKVMIRNYLTVLNEYSRLSDFWVNDIDDGFTILMITNAFKFTELSDQETQIKVRLEEIAKPWFDELN